MREKKAVNNNGVPQKEGIIERLIFKLTSGRFIFTVVVAGVYAYLACSQILPENRVTEITLIVLYAYFNRPRIEVIDTSKPKVGLPSENDPEENKDENGNSES